MSTSQFLAMMNNDEIDCEERSPAEISALDLFNDGLYADDE